MPKTNEREPNPAELFESFFGPSIFSPWARVLLENADPGPGERVLDLACATGIVARNVAPMVGEEGTVVGLDISPDMLAVAREREPADASIEWREGDAAQLDLPDDTFDLVLCQQGVQFFPDPIRALQEAGRVLIDGGRLALNVWQPLEHHPVYAVLLDAEARHLDADLAEVAAPFMFGGAEQLRALLSEAGFDRIEIVERTLPVEFVEPEKFVALTVLAGAAVVPEFARDDPGERAELIEVVTRDSEDTLRQYRMEDRLRFPMPSYIGVAYA